MSNKVMLPVYGGGFMNVLEPDPEMIRVQDIARSHANTSRYMGHSIRPYSIAEHAVRVSIACGIIIGDYAMREGLLHDGSEAYLGEVVRMLKHSDVMSGYRLAEVGMDDAIRSRFNLPEFPSQEIKAIDYALVNAEIRSGLFPYSEKWLLDLNREWNDPLMSAKVADTMNRWPTIPGFRIDLRYWGWNHQTAFNVFMVVADHLGVK